MSYLFMVAALLALVAGPRLVGVAAGAQVAGGCVDDPYDVSDPRAEALRFCAVIVDGVAAFSLDVAEGTDPNHHPSWTQSPTVWIVHVDVNGDEQTDMELRYENVDGGEVTATVFDLGEIDFSCEGDASYRRDEFVAEGLPVSECFGGHTTFQARATFRFASDATAEVIQDAVPFVTPSDDLPAPLAGVGVPTARLGGASRIDTAIDIAQFQFPGGSEEVYLSRADVFADSISSGSLTRGPVLLVPQCGVVPQQVLTEITRLSPRRVVALGGEAAVCDQVLTDAAIAAG